ncbi:MAG: UDP-N-acetylmuramate--L-alanine ligase [Propionibacteriaceae bacterium]|jgi:UDP-N-acetylmuramate--alanine ligase|nr:UDP-N-acetylmuramate--L-alanine ligase [Propionibacteriaceae bacterium]
MPLITPVEVIPITELGPVHFIAIGGAGMSGIAAMYADLGVPVSGSDQADSDILRSLAAHGIRTYVGHQAAQLGDAQTVVISSAVRETNVELAEARRRGLRIWHRSAALAALMLGHIGVSVTGTHGKTTTSAMVAHLLAAGGLDPSYVLGARLADGQSAHLGAGQPFVIEADESDGSYLQYPTQIAVVTNVEMDHGDNWGTEAAYRAGMEKFVTAPNVRAVVLNADDPGSAALVTAAHRVGKQVVLFGYDSQIVPDEFELPVPGEHNLYNFAAAYAVGLLFGIEPETLLVASHSFSPAERRFQTVGEQAGVKVVDDYAHLPTEVAATLAAARERGEGRVVAVFQPHLFTRTQAYAAEFAQALSEADVVVLTDVYAAREDPIAGVTGELIVKALPPGKAAHYVPDFDALPARVAELAQPGDLVLTIGAGSITEIGPKLLERLGAHG